MHASAKDSKLKLNNPTTSSATNQSFSVASPTHLSLRLDKLDTNGSSSIMSNAPDTHCLSPVIQSPPLVAKRQSDSANGRN